MKTGFIDWTEGQINLYVFAGQEHVDTVSVPLEGEPDSSVLSSLLTSGLDQIYLSLPYLSLSLRELTFPFSDKNKIRDTISFELEGLLLGSVNDYVIDHIVTDSGNGSSRVIAACIEKARLRGIIEACLSAGLEPKVITSIDLRLADADVGKLMAGSTSDAGERTNAAQKELLTPSINLRQEELAYTGDIERMKKSLRITASLVLALMLIFSAFSILKFTSAKKQNASLNGELQALYQSVFPEDKKIIDPVKQFKGNLNMLREKKSVLAGIPSLHILDSISNINNRSVTLTEFSSDGKNIIIKGTAAAFQEVDNLKNSLSEQFDGVKVVNSDATADKKINFTLLMQEKAS
ncbi:MAG: hypothetical protein C4538_00340 [Nitrospiraceae bacterium]|nr:MAG: hypothetical protein C4538_00340 [Nitrospiraceae bacterium]